MNATSVIAIIAAVFGSSGLFALIQYLISRHDSKRDTLKKLVQTVEELQAGIESNNSDMKLQSDALMAICHDRICWLGKQYIKQGWISIEDYSSLVAVADAYKAMGGNHIAKTVMDQVDLLEKR